MSDEKPTKRTWHDLAVRCAYDACENNNESRRGVYFIEDKEVLCLYNNNPYANFPTLRDEETTMLRQRMRAEGLEELAYATYPPEGHEDAGYTYAMIISAGEDRIDWVCSTIMEILLDSEREMSRADRSAQEEATK